MKGSGYVIRLRTDHPLNLRTLLLIPEINSQLVDALPIKLGYLRQEACYSNFIIFKVAHGITWLGALILKDHLCQTGDWLQGLHTFQVADVVVI